MRLREWAAEPVFYLAFLFAPRTRISPTQIDQDGFVNVTPEQRRQIATSSWRWRVHSQIAKVACWVGGYSE